MLCNFLFSPVFQLSIFCNCPTVLVYSVPFFPQSFFSLLFNLGTFFWCILKFLDMSSSSLILSWTVSSLLVSPSRAFFTSITMFFTFSIYFLFFFRISISLFTISLFLHGGGGLVAKSCPILAIPERLDCSNLSWTVVLQVPLSMGFSRQEYWSGVPFPSPGDLLTQELNPGSPALQADDLSAELWGKPSVLTCCLLVPL